MTKDKQQGVLTAREASKKARMSYEGLLDAAKRGEVPHIRIGSRVLFPTDFLASIERPATTTTREPAASVDVPPRKPSGVKSLRRRLQGDVLSRRRRMDKDSARASAPD